MKKNERISRLQAKLDDAENEIIALRAQVDAAPTISFARLGPDVKPAGPWEPINFTEATVAFDDEAGAEPKPESVALEAERIINGPRRDAYGPVEESFQRIADGWASITGVPLTVEQVAAMMVWLKVCRELGGKHHRDNLVDICGYTLLWDRLANSENCAVAEVDDL